MFPNFNSCRHDYWDQQESSLETYIEMKDDLVKVAADLQRKNMEEEAFVEYYKFLTWELAVPISFPVTDPSLIRSSCSCFCPVLNLWNLTKTCISLISGNSHTCFSLIFKDMRTKSGGISRVVHKLVPTWPRFEGKHWKESMMSEFVSVLSAQSKHRNSATGLFLCVPDPRTPFA